MGKLLLIGVVVLLLAWLVRPRRPRAPRQPPATPPQIDDIVRCEHCGVHLPRAEAVTARGRTFCCAAHLGQHESGAGASTAATSRDDGQ